MQLGIPTPRQIPHRPEIIEAVKTSYMFTANGMSEATTPKIIQSLMKDVLFFVLLLRMLPMKAESMIAEKWMLHNCSLAELSAAIVFKTCSKVFAA
jgi:hypothetical protein